MVIWNKPPHQLFISSLSALHQLFVSPSSALHQLLISPSSALHQFSVSFFWQFFIIFFISFHFSTVLCQFFSFAQFAQFEACWYFCQCRFKNGCDKHGLSQAPKARRLTSRMTCFTIYLTKAIECFEFYLSILSLIYLFHPTPRKALFVRSSVGNVFYPI